MAKSNKKSRAKRAASQAALKPPTAASQPVAKARAKPNKTAPKVAKNSAPLARQDKPISKAWQTGWAVLYGVQALAILLLSVGRGFPVISRYLAKDALQSRGRGHTVLAQSWHQLFSVNLAYPIAAFLLVAMLAHIFMRVFYDNYLIDAKRGLNLWRWLHYGISGGLVAVSIGLVNGLQDITGIIMLFGIVLVAALAGLIMEFYGRANQNLGWASYGLIITLGVIGWLGIGFYGFGASLFGGQLPTYVYGLDISAWIFSLLFAGQLLLTQKRYGRWADYLFSEKTYMILALLAQGAVAWQLFAAVLN
ncbi:MAG: heliorhodopsin HeR [Candidatus Saccharimonadales bacterium]